MVLRVESSSKKSFRQLYPMPQFAVNRSSSWNMHDQDSSESLSEHLSSKVGSPSRHYLEVKRLGSGLQDQDSSSFQSTSQSQQGGISTGKSNSHDQCLPKTVQDEGYQKHIEGQLDPAFLVGNPGFWANPSQLELRHSSIHIPNFSGLYAAYGPHVIVQQQLVGMAPGRVPLPADLAEDGPMYVNAKQYHAILRRRQMRAKLEAQNKLVKTRKPYLHESRHVHALNRVRGSGGRFLSTKKTQQSEPTPYTSSHSDSVHFHQKGKMLEVDEQRSEPGKRDAPTVTCYGITQNRNNEVNFKQADHRFSSMSSHMAVSLPGRGSHMYNAEQRGAPVVR